MPAWVLALLFAQDDLSLPPKQCLNNLGFELKAGYNYDIAMDEQGQPKARK